MINIDPETKQYLKELVASYEQTIMELQSRVQTLQAEIVAGDDPVLRDINIANQKLQKQLSQHHTAKHMQQLEMQNQRLQARVKSLEEQLQIERRLKYLWAEKPMDDDYKQTQERIREMRKLYHTTSNKPQVPR